MCELSHLFAVMFCMPDAGRFLSDLRFSAPLSGIQQGKLWRLVRGEQDDVFSQNARKKPWKYYSRNSQADEIKDML